MKADYLSNQERNHLLRTGSWVKPSVIAVGLLDAQLWSASTVYALNVYVVATTDTPAGASIRIYKCTSSGTSGASEPTWGLIDGGTTADGTATWTEQTVAMKGGVIPEMPNSGAYARVTLNPLDANWTGAAVGHSDNASEILFAAATADWGAGGNVQDRCVGFFLADSATYAAGNLFHIGIFTLADRKDVNNLDQVRFSIGNLDITEG